MKFFDLFAGIGGFRMGLESLGHHCVGFCEIDKFARTSYKVIYDTEGDIKFYDIRNVTTDAIRGIGRVDLSVEDFRAKLSQLRATDEVLKIHEELSSLRLQGSHLFSDLNIYSLKTLKDSSVMTTELLSKPSSEPWMSWGMMWNGKCLIVRISECPKTENGCSLSDILEEYVPEMYFLSEEKAQQLSRSNQND